MKLVRYVIRHLKIWLNLIYNFNNYYILNMKIGTENLCCYKSINNGTIIIRKKNLCDKCKKSKYAKKLRKYNKNAKEISIKEFLDDFKIQNVIFV